MLKKDRGNSAFATLSCRGKNRGKGRSTKDTEKITWRMKEEEMERLGREHGEEQGTTNFRDKR